MYAIGTVFTQMDNGKRHFWKITGVQLAFGKPHYDVIACSPKGKEYRQRNGFFDIDDRLADPSNETFSIVCLEGENAKANIDAGIDLGTKKRRLKHLRQVIASATDEIKTIMIELSNMDGFHNFVKTLSYEELESLYWATTDAEKQSLIKVELGFRVLAGTIGSEGVEE